MPSLDVQNFPEFCKSERHNPVLRKPYAWNIQTYVDKQIWYKIFIIFILQMCTIMFTINIFYHITVFFSNSLINNILVNSDIYLNKKDFYFPFEIIIAYLTHTICIFTGYIQKTADYIKLNCCISNICLWGPEND